METKTALDAATDDQAHSTLPTRSSPACREPSELNGFHDADNEPAESHVRDFRGPSGLRRCRLPQTRTRHQDK